MKRLIACVFVVAACGKGGDKKKAEPPLEPFKGPLTVAKVMATKDLVKMSDTWEAALAKLQGVVGPPTKIDGDKHYWAAMEGDDCAYFEMRSEDGKVYGKSGKVIGVLSNPETYGKDGAIMNRAECLTLVGKGVAAEDPNAEAPRTDGAPYQVAEVAKLAVAGRSKWKGQTVKVTGIVKSVTTNSSSPGVEIVLGDPADTTDKVRLSCTLDGAPLEVKSSEQTTLQGTVEIREFVRGDGTPGMDAQLVKCTPTKS